MARQIKDLIRMMKYQGTSLSEVRKKTFAGLKPEMSKVWSGFAVSVVVRSTWTNVWIWWKISGKPEEWWRPTQWSACPVLLRCQPPPKHYGCDWKSTTRTKHMIEYIDHHHQNHPSYKSPRYDYQPPPNQDIWSTLSFIVTLNFHIPIAIDKQPK